MAPCEEVAEEPKVFFVRPFPPKNNDLEFVDKDKQMPSLRKKRNNSIGLMGGGRLASCAIVILLMHAILVHIYILHLTDTIVMLHNSGSGGRGNRYRKEKLSPFLKREDNKRNDDTTRTAAVNIRDENNNASITLVVY